MFGKSLFMFLVVHLFAFQVSAQTINIAMVTQLAELSVLIGYVHNLPLVDQKIKFSRVQAKSLFSDLSLLKKSQDMPDSKGHLDFIRNNLTKSQFSLLGQIVESKESKSDQIPNELQIKILTTNAISGQQVNPFYKGNFAYGILNKTLGFFESIQ
jgi:hypothetical protein